MSDIVTAARLALRLLESGVNDANAAGQLPNPPPTDSDLLTCIRRPLQELAQRHLQPSVSA